jgi:hypothetical protein
MAEVKSYKVLSLPQNPTPNSIYWVKASVNSKVSGFITDVNGVPYPLKDDTTPFTGVQTLVNTDGNLQIVGVNNKIINIDPTFLTSLIQAGDNISELVNDAQYLVQADLSDTKAEFNAQLTDGNFLFEGDITQYTNEQAQDAIGTILVDTSTVDLNYNDGLNQISASVKPNSVTSAELANNINISEFNNNENYIDHTDLSVTQNPTNIVIHSDVGADATINLADGTNAGVTENNFTDSEKTKLAGIEDNAEVNILETISSTGNTITVGSNVSKNINIEVVQATESQLGGGQITTQAIIEDETTTNDLKLLTPKKFWQGWTKGLTLTSFFNAVRGTVLTGFSSAVTWARVTTADTILSAYGKLQQSVNYLQSTRVTSGAGISIASSTTFNLQVQGEVIDPDTFLPININVNFTGVSATFRTVQAESYVWVDSTGAIQQSLTPPSPLLYDTIVGYWVLIHSDLTTITVTNAYPLYADGLGVVVHQILDYLGFNKYKGTNLISPGTTGTRITHSGGLVIKNGGGNLTKRPVFNLNGATDSTFTHRNQLQGTEGTSTQTLDVANIDVAGVTTALANNKFSAHKVWKFSSSLVRIQRGQHEYSNITEAKVGIIADTYINEGNAERNGIHIGWVVFKKNTSWGTGGTGVLGTDYLFLDAQGNNSASAFVSPTLQAAYDVSTQPQITTNSTKGAVQLKRGSASDTDHVIEILNGAGTVTAWVAGDGTSSWLSNTTTAYTDATLPLTGTEVAILNDGTNWVKITWNNIKANLKTYFDTLYQAVLVSGTNIKTINGASVLGSGDLVVGGGSLRTFFCEFIINQNVTATPTGNTQWFSRSPTAGINGSFTLDSSLDVSTSFATHQVLSPCYSLPFQAKIKSVYVRGWHSSSNTTGVDFAVLKSKETGPTISSSSLAISNPLIIARENILIFVPLAGNGFLKQFDSSSLTTTTLPLGSDIRLVFKNQNTASPMWDTLVTVEFEEVI